MKVKVKKDPYDLGNFFFYLYTFVLGEPNEYFWAKRPMKEQLDINKEKENDPWFVKYPEEMSLQEELKDRWIKFKENFTDRDSALEYLAVRINQLLFWMAPRMRDWWLKWFSNKSVGYPVLYSHHHPHSSIHHLLLLSSSIRTLLLVEILNMN